MKKIIYILLLTINCLMTIQAQISKVDLFPPDLDKGIEYYFTDDIRKSIAMLQAHQQNPATKNNNALLLEDINRLFESLSIREGKPSEEIIHLSKKLMPFPEYHDLLAICHLTAGNVFLQLNDSVLAESRFENLYYVATPESTLGRGAPTSIQVFMMAFGDYLCEIPHKTPQVTMGDTGMPARCNIMRTVFRSRSALRQLCPLPVTPSKCEIVNILLLRNLRDLLHLDVSAGFKAATDRAYNVMCQTMDIYIAEWMRLQYPIEHLVYYIVNNKDDVSFSNKRERLHDQLLKELSVQGSGAASYYMGNRLEQENSKNHQNPALARQYYETSSSQNYPAGTMRLATCMTMGYGGNVDMQRAYSLLKPLIGHADFAKNGSYAYAILLENKIGGKPDLLDVMNYYATAADEAIGKAERDTSLDKCNQLYEKYYK